MEDGSPFHIKIEVIQNQITKNASKDYHKNKKR